MSRGMFIELVGAAGVGKSMLADCLTPRLRQSGINAIQFDAVRISRLTPRTLLALVEGCALALRLKPRSWSVLRKGTAFFAAYAIRRELCNNTAVLQIASEGLFQKGRLYHRNSTDLSMEQAVDLLLSRLSPPDVVILVEASAETIWRRRRQRRRKDDAFDLDAARNDVALMEQSAAVAHQVKDRFGPTKLHVLHVQLDDDIDDSTLDAITAQLTEVWESHAR